jgi:cellulose biosynthesis protein BcsQ
VLSVAVPRSVRMAEAPGKGMPGILWSPRNAASEQYKRLALELAETSLADTVVSKLQSQ